MGPSVFGNPLTSPSPKQVIHFLSSHLSHCKTLAMATTSASRRRASASPDPPHASPPPTQRDGDNPVRLRLKVSPPNKKHGDDTNGNGQTDPPNEATHPRIQLPNPSPSTSTNMCAPIIRPLKRTREHDVSESDISVLDLGPSLTQLDNRASAGEPTLAETRSAPLNAATRIRESRFSLRNGPLGPLDPYPYPPRSRLNDVHSYYQHQRARAEVIDSEPVSADSDVSPADESLPNLTLRRHQPELYLDLRHRTGLRAPPRRRVSRSRSPFTGDIHCLGYGFGFGGYERVQDQSSFYIVESDLGGDIRSTARSSSHESVEVSHSAQAGPRRVRYPIGSWDRRSSDLFTTGLPEYEQELELFPGVDVDEMVN